MCNWQTVVPLKPPWALPLIMKPHMPQMPSRQSWSKATGSSPFSIRLSFSTSSISRNDMCSFTSGTSYRTRRPRSRTFFCRQTWSISFILLVAPLRRLYVIEDEWLLVQRSGAARTLEFPCGDVRKVGVVAQGLTIGRLVLLAEMTAAGFVAVQRISTHQFAKFEKIGHAAGFLERLVKLLVRA